MFPRFLSLFTYVELGSEGEICKNTKAAVANRFLAEFFLRDPKAETHYPF
jgi:hypothetical protein